MALRSSCLRCGAVCMGSLCPPHKNQAVKKANGRPKTNRQARGFTAEYDANRKRMIDRAWYEKTPCYRCGKAFQAKRFITADHVIARADGGGNELGNLAPAHHWCNSSAGGRMNRRRVE